jgi:hypothetical protein
MSSFRKPLTVREVTGGGYDSNGRWAGETEAPLTIRASVQPSSPKDLQALPENRRTHASFTLYTDTLLRTVESQNPHRVRLFGDDYEVVAVEAWQNGVRPHFKAIVQKRAKIAEAVDA